MTERLIDLFYARIGFPLLLFGMKILARFDKKIELGLKMREPQNGIEPWLNFPRATQPIWLHCASGEFEYAKPVITRLKKINSSPILVTYFSPSIKKAIESFAGVDMSTPLPWDREDDWARFLEHHKPKILLIARTDTWPEMLKQVHEFKIPSLLFSATLVQNSGRARGISRFLSRKVFRLIDQIYCVSPEDKLLFDDLGCSEKTVIAGDTRFDQVIERLKNPKPIAKAISKGNRPVLVAGSTWDEDEKILLPVLATIKGKIQSIIVPHEPHLDHIKTLESRCSTNGLSFDRLSKLTQEWVSDVLIIDQTGILAELYQLADFAFVGGSFKKTVHSVMEPLAAGCPTFVGPLHLNNREALSFKELKTSVGLPCVLVVNNEEEFVKKLSEICKLSGSDLSDVKKYIRNEVLKRSGKSDLVVKWVQANLK